LAEYAVISCSLRASSRSRLLAEQLVRDLRELNGDAAFADLREYNLPLCDGGAAYKAPGVRPLLELISGARVIFLAVPVYNYYANAAAKNLIELTGDAWEDKIAGFLCAAGGDSSYMSIMNIANSLMLDFRCVILPRFVYATGGDFTGERISSEDILSRIRQLAATATMLRQISEEKIHE